MGGNSTRKMCGGPRMKHEILCVGQQIWTQVKEFLSRNRAIIQPGGCCLASCLSKSDLRYPKWFPGPTGVKAKSKPCATTKCDPKISQHVFEQNELKVLQSTQRRSKDAKTGYSFRRCAPLTRTHPSPAC